MGGTEFSEGGSAGYWSGGNGLYDGSALSYIPEMAWNDTAMSVADEGGLSASGGGISSVYKKPAWQSGPGVPNDGARHVPDLALSASADHDGYYVYTGGSSAYNLSTDDFMKLFLAQLQNQDPTKPVDDSQMLNELSQMTQVSTLQGVQTALQGSQLAQSSALIGKNVTGLDVNGAAVDGVVTSVTQSTDAGLVLQVGTQYIKPDSVTAVTNPVASGTTGTTTP